MSKDKTTVEEQINILKLRNIKFNIINESDAKKFLVEKSYYFKLSAYRKNFDYRKLPNGEIVYKDLDFAYLKELSKIDMYLRYMILELSLDIEHFLKKSIVEDVTNDICDDGKTAVNHFLSNNSLVKNKIMQHSKSPYTSSLINVYSKDMPVWVFVEVCTFGDFLYFYREYYKSKNKILPIDNKILNQIKSLRNACAHNNCIINDLDKCTPTNSHVNIILKKWCINLLQNRSRNCINNMLRKQAIYDFVALLYVYCTLSTKIVKTKKIKRLYDLFNDRIKEHKDYFAKNQRLLNVYNFVFDIIRSLNT